MEKVLKRSLSILLAITIIFSSAYVGLGEVDLGGLFAIEANAATIVDSGTCGTNVTWTLDDAGKLTISGTGNMTNYFVFSDVPWYSLRASVKTVVVDNGVTSIGFGAFGDCTSLTSITIPNSVTSIGYLAFAYCTRLTSISIPDSVTSIDTDAFIGCTSLTSITIPNSVTSIGGFAFYDCTSLTSIIIPNSVISIGAAVFDNTGYYNNNSNWENGVLYIGVHLLEAKESITGTYKVKNGTKNIAESAFGDCDSLTSIIIPNSVTRIASCAFSGCESLTNITIPNSVISIGTNAFSGCESLTNITIPNSVTSIDTSVFSGCESLANITIPNSVTSIGCWAFDGCTNLKYVFYSGSKTAWNAINVDKHNEPLKKAIIHYNATDHNYKVIKKATFTENGKSETKCTVCGYVSKSTVIYSPKTIKLSTSTCTYNGKVRTPSVNVKDSKGKTLVNGIDYKVSVPSGRKLPGIYKYTITFMGKYSGTKNLTFKILPATVDAAKITATQTSSSIKLTWNKVTGVTGYKIYQYSPSKGKYVQIATVTGNTYQKTTNLKACTTYKFKVKAYKKLSDGAVLDGVASNAYTTATKCAAPKLVKVVNGPNGIEFSWKPISNVEGYIVCRKEGNGSWKRIAKLSGASKSSYVDKDLKPGVKYTYTVKAYKSGVYSYYNESGLPIVRLSKAGITGLYSVSNGVKITWHKTTGADGYMVYRSTGNGEFIKIATIKGYSNVSYVDKTAKKGVKYTYRTKAYNGASVSATSDPKSITR